MKILIIEDDIKIANFLETTLITEGFSVDCSNDGILGWEKIISSSYDVVILDVMLPGIDGLSILSQMRAKMIMTPVLILSAKKTLEDRLAGLQQGGDDYLVKPFAFAELLARINALLRRSLHSKKETKLVFDDLEIDLEKREVKRLGQVLSLQSKEYALLAHFMQNPGVVMTKSLILEKIWGYDFDPQTNVVDVLVCRLRNKVDKDFQKKLIHTHRGIGYVFNKL